MLRYPLPDGRIIMYHDTLLYGASHCKDYESFMPGKRRKGRSEKDKYRFEWWELVLLENGKKTFKHVEQSKIPKYCQTACIYALSKLKFRHCWCRECGVGWTVYVKPKVCTMCGATRIKLSTQVHWWE